MNYHPATMIPEERQGCAPHTIDQPPYERHWNVRTATGAILASYYDESAAAGVAAMLDQETAEADARDRGEEITPRPAIITGERMPDHWEESYPPQWQHTGAPSIIIIDAANMDHWQRYVWSHTAGDPGDRYAATTDRVPARNSGYEIGYYPLDTENAIAWEMIPDGPYCAACIDPINDYANPNPRASHDYPQAFHAEMIESPDEDDDGNPIPRCCVGCGAVLYEPDEYDWPAPTREEIRQGQHELCEAYAAHLDAEMRAKARQERQS